MVHVRWQLSSRGISTVVTRTAISMSVPLSELGPAGKRAGHGNIGRVCIAEDFLMVEVLVDFQVGG